MKPNGKLQSQLNEIRSNIPATQQKNPTGTLRNPIHSPMLWKGDNIDHINISEYAQSELGQFLSHRHQFKFEHDIFGHFTTMEAFDHFILSHEKDDRLRRLTGSALKKFAGKLTRVKVPNFKAIVIDTNYKRIMQNEKMKQLMKESTLPFDVYFVIEKSGFRSRPLRYPWLLQGMEEIRAAIKEDRVPDLNFLMTDRKNGIYGPVLKTLGLNKPEAKQEKTKEKKQDCKLVAQTSVEESPLTEAVE